MTMPETASIRRHALPLLLGGIVVSLLAGTIMLWAHYGTAIFLEMIQSGLVACFG